MERKQKLFFIPVEADVVDIRAQQEQHNLVVAVVEKHESITTRICLDLIILCFKKKLKI